MHHGIIHHLYKCKSLCLISNHEFLSFATLSLMSIIIFTITTATKHWFSGRHCSEQATLKSQSLLRTTSKKRKSSVCVLLLLFEFKSMKIRKWISEAYLECQCGAKWNPWNSYITVSRFFSPSGDGELKPWKVSMRWCGTEGLPEVLQQAGTQPQKDTGPMHTFYHPLNLNPWPWPTELPIFPVNPPPPLIIRVSNLYNHCLFLIFVLFHIF